jgi:hypothetical protein
LRNFKNMGKDDVSGENSALIKIFWPLNSIFYSSKFVLSTIALITIKNRMFFLGVQTTTKWSHHRTKKGIWIYKCWRNKWMATRAKWLVPRVEKPWLQVQVSLLPVQCYTFFFN